MVIHTPRTGPSRWILFLLLAFICMARAGPAGASSEGEDPFADLKAMSLEELVNVKITSVSKKSEKLSEAAAAVYVITNEEIRRSGATTIPDLLRTVPGLHVAQLNAQYWAISARGFNGQFANKLLVLIDGRSVYSPLFSGVHWAIQDTILEDIERIEVIRGPGASVWGANAVNGVINIITRNARDSQGGLVSLGYGNEEQGFARARQGGALGEDAWFRVYGKFTRHDSADLDEAWADSDEWAIARGGFRIDWDVSDETQVTVQGDTYQYDAQSTWLTPSVPSVPFDNDTVTRGTNLLARWTHAFSEESEVSFQTYFDHVDFNSPVFPRVHNTIDGELQHRFHLGEDHEIVWGLGYRSTREGVQNTIFFSNTPRNRENNLISAFVQDEINVVEELVRLTLGTKVEHNDYTGYEVQPTARLLWTPHESHTAWAAASRAVRTPSTIETGDWARVGTTGALVNTLLGNDDFESEELVALELGYRVIPADSVSLDLATFYNKYDHLRTFEGPTVAPPAILFVTDNKMEGHTFGAELAANWVATDWWRLRCAYTFFEMNLEPEASSTDTTSEGDEDASPHHQVSLRSSIDITETVELDAGLRFVDRLEGPDIDNHTGFDLRLAYRPFDGLEVAIVGQDIFAQPHREFAPFFDINSAAKIEQCYYLQVSLRF